MEHRMTVKISLDSIESAGTTATEKGEQAMWRARFRIDRSDRDFVSTEIVLQVVGAQTPLHARQQATEIFRRLMREISEAAERFQPN
jgi:hypothetical protein